MIVKKLTKEDFYIYKGFYKTLNNLTSAEELPVDFSIQILEEINHANGHVFVGIVDNEIVCSITVLIERKFIRGGAKCAHIEDVVTRKEFEGKGIGTQVLQAAIDFATQESCYKIILDCEEELLNFYGKSGFKNSGIYASKRFI
jgi:glucosamine-phosphate N-acetyltransferase